jgi:hypothetical protein
MEAVQNCRLIEVSTPELDDVVRLLDDYDRETKKLKKGIILPTPEENTDVI